MWTEKFKDVMMLSPNVKEVRSEDGAVLLDVEQGLCFSLNSLGCTIWDLLKRGCSVEQLLTELESQYENPRSQLAKDLQDFLVDLESRGLLLIGQNHDQPQDGHGFLQRFWSRRIKRRISKF